MDRQRRFYQKCVCGSEIEFLETHGIIADSRTVPMFQQWQADHKNCLPLFHQVQHFKMARMELTAGHRPALNEDVAR